MALNKGTSAHIGVTKIPTQTSKINPLILPPENKPISTATAKSAATETAPKNSRTNSKAIAPPTVGGALLSVAARGPAGAGGTSGTTTLAQFGQAAPLEVAV